MHTPQARFQLPESKPSTMDILLVDDDETLRLSLTMLLENEGYTVAAAESGERALDLAREHYYDLVLCDVRMPGMDGIEAVGHLKDSIADAYFIVMTGYASEEAPVEALRLGVNDYLNKPFDLPLFLEKVRSVARRRRRPTETSGLGLWDMVSSLREYLPGLAAQAEIVEELCLDHDEASSLDERDTDKLRLGAWFHPLASFEQEATESDPPQEVIPSASDPTDELGRLLRELAIPGERTAVAKLLYKALALSKGGVAQGRGCSSVATSDDPAVLAAQNRLVVTTFGGFHLILDGKKVTAKTWQSAKARWLFLYLLTRGGQSVPEGRLAETFWPDSPSEKAHRALVSSVHRARKALNDSDLIVRYDCGYGLARDCDYSLDSEDFIETYVRGGRFHHAGDLAKALECFQAMSELYRGDFVLDCPLRWCSALRDDYRLKMGDAYEKGAAILLLDDAQKSEDWSRRALLLESTSEPAWACLLRALASQGRRDQVEASYQNCVQTLETELNLKPGLALRQVYETCLV